MISKSGDQKQRSDQGWISWVGLGVQSMEIWLVEIQLMYKLTLSRKDEFKDLIKDCNIRNILNQGTQDDKGKGHPWILLVIWN